MHFARFILFTLSITNSRRWHQAGRLSLLRLARNPAPSLARARAVHVASRERSRSKIVEEMQLSNCVGSEQTRDFNVQAHPRAEADSIRCTSARTPAFLESAEPATNKGRRKLARSRGAELEGGRRTGKRKSGWRGGEAEGSDERRRKRQTEESCSFSLYQKYEVTLLSRPPFFAGWAAAAAASAFFLARPDW